MSEITPELLAWSGRKADRYRLRYGDREGRFEGCVGVALDRAARTWRPGGATFASHARHVVIEALNQELRRSGPKGYRHDPRLPGRRLGAPEILPLSDLDRESRSADGPVGWEVDYEDLVSSLARKLPGSQGDVIRAVYLECAGGTIGRVARGLGLSRSRTSEIHSAAIARLRSRKSDW